MNGIEAIRRAKALLEELSKGGQLSQVSADELMRLLGHVEKDFKALANVGEAAVVRPARSRKSVIRYEVDGSHENGALAEHRASGSTRCPKAIYEAVAHVLTDTAEGLDLDQIMARLAGELGDRPGEFQVRVALRFWLSSDPPLLSRTRAKYRAVKAETMLRDARAVWNRLKECDAQR